MKNKKQHVLIGGYQGIIYYSWLFVILFVGLIFELESPDGGYSIPGIVIMALFLVLAIFTYFNTFVEKKETGELIYKLPYKSKKTIADQDVTIINSQRHQTFKIKGNGIKFIKLHKKDNKAG